MYSRKSAAPSGTMRKGDKEPMSAAFATLLCVAPEKNIARFRPKNTPGISACRTSRSVTRRPVARRYTFQTIETVTIRQNANSTPGECARFASVELIENATTTPTTARAPSVRALRVLNGAETGARRS